MYTCKEIARILSSGEKLPVWKRVELCFHLFMCRHCAGYRRLLKITGERCRKFLLGGNTVDPADVLKIEEAVIKAHSEDKP